MKKDGRYTCKPFEFAIASLDEVFVFHLGIVNLQDTFAIGLLILTDAQWAKIEPLCTGKANDRGPTADNRMFIEAVLWIARTGSPWRDLPKEFGKWNSVFQRYRRWSKAGRFTGIFGNVSGEADMAYAMIDGCIVKVHRHGQGAKGGP